MKELMVRRRLGDQHRTLTIAQCCAAISVIQAVAGILPPVTVAWAGIVWVALSLWMLATAVAWALKT